MLMRQYVGVVLKILLPALTTFNCSRNNLYCIHNYYIKKKYQTRINRSVNHIHFISFFINLTAQNENIGIPTDFSPFFNSLIIL